MVQVNKIHTQTHQTFLFYQPLPFYGKNLNPHPFCKNFEKINSPHYMSTVIKININHTSETMQTFNPISFHAQKHLNVTFT